MENVERVVQFSQMKGFMSGEDLMPYHCDVLEQACLQNGDIPTIEYIELARRNWPVAKHVVFTRLTDGYKVFRNDAQRLI